MEGLSSVRDYLKQEGTGRTFCSSFTTPQVAQNEFLKMSDYKLCVFV